MPPKSKKAVAAAVSHTKAEKKSSRVSISKQIHEEGNYDDTEDENAKKKAEQIANNLTPLQNGQLKLLKGAIEFFSENYSTEKFVLTLLIGFLINVMYSKYIDEFSDDIYTVAFCWLGALTSYTVSYITQQKAINKAVTEGSIAEDSPLAKAKPPSFDRLYATTLPVMVAFLVRRDLLVLNLALTYLLLELPAAIKLFISVTVMYNFQEQDNVLDCTFVPALHWVVETTIDQYTGESLTDVEKYSFATMFVNLMYANPDKGGDTILVIFKYLVYWFGGLFFVSTPLVRFCRKQDNKLVRKGLLMTIYIVFVAVFYKGVVTSLTRVLGEHPVLWLKNFIVATDLRFNIFKIWLVGFVTLVPLVVRLSTNWDLQLKRKIWHFIVFGMLLYPTVVDPLLSKIALMGLIGIFVVVEILRSSDLPPFGPYLRSILQPFQDERDTKGPVVISYLFLLCGIALPIFFNNSVAGLVCLGVGDSAASIVGKKMGQVKWFESNKTMEGSIAFIFATTLAMYLYKFLGGVDYSWNTIFMSCVFTSILEALCEINDNLLTPVFMFVMLEVLHYKQ